MYANKDRNAILRDALQKLQTTTPITAIGPGSVARALAESVTNEIGDFYSAMDFNTAMGYVSTAQGRALDLIGELYNVRRKQLGEIATLDESVGSFYFYVDTPHTADIIIPAGTVVSTEDFGPLGEQYTYQIIREAVLPAGRTRVYVSIRPTFSDSVFTAGKNTITRHNITPPEGVELKATNPKAIQQQPGFESDENYRTRITNAVRTSAGGTLTAVRFAGLSVDGVRDIRVRNTPYGLGSAEALVTPEDRRTAVSVVARVIDELERVRPAGVRLFIREPDYAPCAVRATIIIREGLNVTPEGTARRAENLVLRFLNGLLPGEKLIYSQLVQAILDSSDVIQDTVVTSLRVNGVELLRRNFTPEDDVQIVPGEIQVVPA